MKMDDFLQKYNVSYISSRTNPRIVAAGKLNEKKYRDREEIFLADGSKLAAEALKFAKPTSLYVAESAVSNFEDIVYGYCKAGVPVFVVADSSFEKISTEKSPEGIITALVYLNELHIRETGDCINAERFDNWQKNKRLIMLDGIRPGKS